MKTIEYKEEENMKKTEITTIEIKRMNMTEGVRKENIYENPKKHRKNQSEKTTHLRTKREEKNYEKGKQHVRK